jgi:hypothetical protein
MLVIAAIMLKADDMIFDRLHVAVCPVGEMVRLPCASGFVAAFGGSA